MFDIGAALATRGRAPKITTQRHRHRLDVGGGAARPFVEDDLLPIKDQPCMLFDTPERAPGLMVALDAVNDRFGKKTMVLASEGTSPAPLSMQTGQRGRPWKPDRCNKITGYALNHMEGKSAA